MLVCYCKFVEEATIRTAWVNGAKSVEKIKAVTKAGSGCQSCAMTLEWLVRNFQREDRYQKKQTSANQLSLW